jgi:hypothetical protein
MEEAERETGREIGRRGKLGLGPLILLLAVALVVGAAVAAVAAQCT